MSNSVTNYGWSDANRPESCNYIQPQILRILSRTVSYSSHICDLGSGNGALAGALKSFGYSVCGIEYDSDGCRIARELHPNVPFYNLGVQDDPSQIVESEGRFDAVISTEVIEHLFSPHLLAQFAREILREDGVLIISTPYHGYLKNLALSLLNKWDHHHTPLWHGGHIKFWSRETLTKLLESNGLRVIEFHGVGRFPYLWKSMILVAKVC